MREILFRGKRVDNGEWVYSQTVFSHLDNFYIHAQNFKCTVMRNLDTVGNISEIRCKGGNYFFKVQTETIGQYTGLTDKDGKKIYEGDIITVLGVEGFYCMVVEYVEDLAAFMGVSRNKKGEIIYLTRFKDDDFIIIEGNIHDNPELLEMEK